MAIELCTPQTLNFSCSREGQTGSRPPYLLYQINIEKLANSRNVLQQLRYQFIFCELAVEEVWRLYQRVYTENDREVRYKMTSGTAIETRLGHIPITVIAWRETGTGPFDIEIIGCVDTSRMPSNHPNIFNGSSPAPLPPSSKCSKIIRGILAFRRTSSSTWPNSPCQIQKIPSNLLLNMWNRIAQIRPCILIALLFSPSYHRASSSACFLL